MSCTMTKADEDVEIMETLFDKSGKLSLRLEKFS